MGDAISKKAFHEHGVMLRKKVDCELFLLDLTLVVAVSYLRKHHYRVKLLA